MTNSGFFGPDDTLEDSVMRQFRAGFDTREIARKLSIHESEAERLLNRALDRRATGNA